MGPENATQMGYILLIVGVALSIIGYVIYLNIRGEKEVESSEGQDEEATIASMDSTQDSSDWLQSLQGKSSPIGDTTVVHDASPSKAEESPTPEGEKETDGPEDEEEKPSLISPSETELIPVASLYREGVSGQVVIKVGDRQYSDLETLRTSRDWLRVKSVSDDLVNWLEAKSVSSKATSLDDTALTAPTDSPASVSNSMIVQINDIISRKVQSLEGEDREIKLVEGAIGALEVRIGVEKFPIDEVPYADVRELIQEAVSQWEKSQ